MSKTPVLFIGHGNPMNTIEENEFSKSWKQLAREFSKPKAILCVSAHWLTRDTWVSATEKPETIYDFIGFPEELFKVKYRAPGSPEYAKKTQDLVVSTSVKSDIRRGLDHGVWSVLNQMYPNAEIPTFQMSIDIEKPSIFHYTLGREISKLREMGVLILGSGNIVHNLSKMVWTETAFDWAMEFDQKIKDAILKRVDNEVIEYEKMGKISALSVPTPDHYYPLLYVLGASEKTEPIAFSSEKCTMGSLSMTSVKIG